jgi:hypothetical protein
VHSSNRLARSVAMARVARMFLPRRLLVAALVPGALAAGIAAAPSTAATAKPGLISCEHKLTHRPASILLFCGDGSVGINKIRWSSFGAATATGTGTLLVNKCEPSCADGNYDRSKITITLTKPKTFAGKRSYSVLKMTTTATGKSAGIYDINRFGPYEREGQG